MLVSIGRKNKGTKQNTLNLLAHKQKKKHDPLSQKRILAKMF
jgi:hypothetical protein